MGLGMEESRTKKPSTHTSRVEKEKGKASQSVLACPLEDSANNSGLDEARIGELELIQLLAERVACRVQ